MAKRPVAVRITRDLAGVWSLWIEGELIDQDHDAELAAMDEILRWAENVAYYERKVHVDSWTPVSADDQLPEYVATVREDQ